MNSLILHFLQLINHLLVNLYFAPPFWRQRAQSHRRRHCQGFQQLSVLECLHRFEGGVLVWVKEIVVLLDYLDRVVSFRLVQVQTLEGRILSFLQLQLHLWLGACRATLARFD